jgi:hypothetical protein
MVGFEPRPLGSLSQLSPQYWGGGQRSLWWQPAPWTCFLVKILSRALTCL